MHRTFYGTFLLFIKNTPLNDCNILHMNAKSYYIECVTYYMEYEVVLSIQCDAENMLDTI